METVRKNKQLQSALLVLPSNRECTRARLSLTSIDDRPSVNVFEREDDLSCIEARSMFREATGPTEMEEEFAASAVIEHEVQFGSRLEGESERNDVRVTNVAHDVALGSSVLHLVARDHVSLVEGLECVQTTAVNFAHHLQRTSRAHT